MIDVSPFHEKLNLLKEYINAGIDTTGHGVWINLDAMSSFTPQEIIEIWESTGWLIQPTQKEESDLPRKLSFEEWLETHTHKGITEQIKN